MHALGTHHATAVNIIYGSVRGLRVLLLTLTTCSAHLLVLEVSIGLSLHADIGGNSGLALQA